MAVVVEDDAEVADLLVSVLSEAGFWCRVAPDGESGIAAVREHDPVLTTLDIGLPGIDGFEVARRLRAFSTTYVMMVSARSDEVDILMGLDSGADDYLTKPVRPRELRARVEAMLRRLSQLTGGTREDAEAVERRPLAQQSDPDCLREVDGSPAGWLAHNGLRMHPQMRLSEIDGQSVELTRSEFELMLTILERRCRVATKNELVQQLRGRQSGSVTENDRRSVEVHLTNLRRKLSDPAGRPRLVQTVRGIGYRLAPEIFE